MPPSLQYPVFAGGVYQRWRGLGAIVWSLFRNLVVPAARRFAVPVAKKPGRALLKKEYKNLPESLKALRKENLSDKRYAMNSFPHPSNVRHKNEKRRNALRSVVYVNYLPVKEPG